MCVSSVTCVSSVRQSPVYKCPLTNTSHRQKSQHEDSSAIVLPSFYHLLIPSKLKQKSVNNTRGPSPSNDQSSFISPHKLHLNGSQRFTATCHCESLITFSIIMALCHVCMYDTVTKVTLCKVCVCVGHLLLCLALNPHLYIC